jgi:tetratricopeptide (TPR) repeat protein
MGDVEGVTTLRDSNPYLGARSFTEDDQHRFFGRAVVARALVDSWRSNRLTIFHGRAGAGKTSLVKAGALALLRNAPGGPPPVGWLGAVGRLPGGPVFPLAAFPELNPYTFALLASWTAGPTPARIRMTPVAKFLRLRRRTDWSGAAEPLLLAVDRAELWFCGKDASRRLDCLAELLDAVADVPHARLMLVVQDEWVDELLDVVKRHGRVPYTKFELADLDRRQALEAVAAPLCALDRGFAPDAAEDLLDAMSVPGAVPEIDTTVLQVVCRSLAAGLPEHVRAVTAARLPDVDQVLADYCAAAIAAAARIHRTDPSAVLGWLREVAVAREPIPAGPMPEAVARMLAARHLVAVSLQDGELRYRLQHPRLARALSSTVPAPPWSPEPGELLAEAETALAAGDAGTARDLAKRAAGAASDGRAQVELDTFRGNVAHLLDRPAEAEHRYRDAAGLLQTLPEADPTAVARQLAAVGWTLFQQGAADRGVALLRSAVARTPSDPMMQAGLGKMLWYAGDPDSAYTILSGVLTRDGDTSEALRARGEILADRGDAESALHDLDRVVSDARPSTRAARALALARLQRIDAARAELAVAVAAAADSGPVLYRAAQVERISGRPHAATEYADRAVRAQHPPLPSHLKAAARRLSAGA